MRKSIRQFCKLTSMAVLTLPLVCGFAVAQTTPISGTYGFGSLVVGFDTGDNNGGAVLGIINFDGAGGLTGTAVIQTRDESEQQVAPTIPSSFKGTYSMNPDGTVAAKLALDVGFEVSFTLVFSDNGQQFHFAGKAGFLDGGTITLQGTPQSLTANVPMALFVAGASGNISVPLPGITNGTAGATVFTGGGVSGNGAVNCPDGSTGTWNAAVSNVTVIAGPDLPAVATRGGGTRGDFLVNVGGRACGDFFRLTKFGPMTGTVAAGGATNLTLRTFGESFGGIGRVAKGGSLNGSYGFSLNFTPFPNTAAGVMKFDGAGNVTATLLVPATPDPINLSGTYVTNPDGSGTITLKTAAGQNAGSYAFVITDGGSSFLLLSTGIAPAGNLSLGVGRLQ